MVHAGQRMHPQPLPVQADIQRVRPQRADQQRVAIGRRGGDRLEGHGAAAARPVLHHELLADLGRELRGDQPRVQVGIAAGGERHHDPDRPVRVVRAGRAWLRGSGAGQGQQQGKRAGDHAGPPMACSSTPTFSTSSRNRSPGFR